MEEQYQAVCDGKINKKSAKSKMQTVKDDVSTEERYRGLREAVMKYPVSFVGILNNGGCFVQILLLFI